MVLAVTVHETALCALVATQVVTAVLGTAHGLPCVKVAVYTVILGVDSSAPLC